MTLYEIDAQISALVDPDSGEILDFDALDALEMAREAKIENIALAYKNLAANANAIKAESDALTKRAAAVKAKADRLKEYLAYALNGETLDTPRVRVTFRRTPEAVRVDNEAALREWAAQNARSDCFRDAKPPEPDKAKIKELLHNGEKIPGVRLEAGTALKIE